MKYEPGGEKERERARRPPFCGIDKSILLPWLVGRRSDYGYRWPAYSYVYSVYNKQQIKTNAKPRSQYTERGPTFCDLFATPPRVCISPVCVLRPSRRQSRYLYFFSPPPRDFFPFHFFSGERRRIFTTTVIGI